MTTLNTEPAGRRRSNFLWIALILLVPATVLAFVKSYFEGITFSRLSLTPLIHVHTTMMTVWIMMLPAQAWFVRTRRFRVHRIVGRSSFIIVPLIVITTIMAAHESLARKPEIDPVTIRFEIYTWGQVVPFLLAWMLAMFYRRTPRMHVRYILCTPFAFASAILLRIIYSWFDWVPGIGMENLQTIEAGAVVNGVIILIALLWLIIADWRTGIRRSPYWLVFASTLFIHVGFFTLAKTTTWTQCVEWFANL